MIGSLRWLRLFANACFFILMLTAALNHKAAVYLIYQAKGQLSLLATTQTFDAFKSQVALSPEEIENLDLIQEIKRYSVDSLSYSPTKNFTRIYNQGGKPILWVITASAPYALRPYEWWFPIVGTVSYKGFFKKEFAQQAYNHMVASGYDVDLRSVSAWSTLGWFHDPVLSSMLKRSKGSLCNLLFHELFHSTYYAASSVNFNENIASFIAHKATLRFLKNDSLALRVYLQNRKDNTVYNKFMLRSIKHLTRYYKTIENRDDKWLLKLKFISQLADSIDHLPLINKTNYLSRKKEILKFKNAYFVDFVQYDSMQDSLEDVFNKIYTGKIEKMVRDLKLN